MPGPSAASASARTSALVIIPARCSKAALGERPAVGRARRPDDCAAVVAAPSAITTFGAGKGGSRRRPPAACRGRGDDHVAAVSAETICSAAPRFGEDRDLRVAQRGVDRGARVAPWAETTIASSHGTPSRAKATATDDGAGRTSSVPPHDAQRAHDPEEARVAARQHAHPPRVLGASARRVAPGRCRAPPAAHPPARAPRARHARPPRPQRPRAAARTPAAPARTSHPARLRVRPLESG